MTIKYVESGDLRSNDGSTMKVWTTEWWWNVNGTNLGALIWPFHVLMNIVILSLINIPYSIFYYYDVILTHYLRYTIIHWYTKYKLYSKHKDMFNQPSPAP